jgi:hypothetical protein
MKQYKFIKTGNSWYIDLPEYLEQGGNPGDLQMVDGADKMLDMMAGENEAVELMIGKETFEGADMLILTEKCEPYIGGGYYLMKEYDGQKINQRMWLCAVTEFVFGDIPPKIFVMRTK